MLKRLLLITAVLLPIGTNSTSAQMYPGDVDYDDPYDYSDYGDDDYIRIDKKFLTPAERGQLATMQARAEKREAQWLAKLEKEAEEQAERESIRQSQCTIPILWLGCPPKAGS